jgi:hypothetical protein
MVKELDLSAFDEETQKELARMQKDLHEVSRQAKKILKDLDVKVKPLRRYMSDSRNFHDNEWKELQDVKKEVLKFRKDLFEAVGIDVEKKEEEKKKEKWEQEEQKELLLKKREIFKKKIERKKKQDTKSSRRKKKMMGFNKGWMRMD